MFLFDTSIVSSVFRKDLIARLYHGELAAASASYLSAQTLGETFVGANLARWGTERRRRMHLVLGRFVALSIDTETAQVLAELVSAARDLGRPLSPQDAWIMATAKQYMLTLFSHDADMRIGEVLGVKVVCRA